ncbi:MAG: hypothetical protein KDK56_04535 [Simkania sp.]|nr:hypothetical protein [Simkania sp.]
MMAIVFETKSSSNGFFSFFGKKSDPNAVAIQLITLFGSDSRHYTILCEALKGKHIELETFQRRQKLHDVILKGMIQKKPVEELPEVKDQLKQCGFSSSSPVQMQLRNMIQMTGFTLYDIQRLSRHHKLFEPSWETIQQAQATLSTELYTTLIFSQKSEIPLSKLGSMHLFSSAGLFTPNGPIFWGELILEWTKLIPGASDIGIPFLKQHPQSGVILGRKGFLPTDTVRLANRTLPPRLPPSSQSEACAFHQFVVSRTIEAIEWTVGGPPFPVEIKEYLANIFTLHEATRMDVSFATSYPSQLLKDELAISGKTPEILSFLRILFNFNLGHVSKEDRKNAAVQQIYSWAFATNSENVRGLLSHEYPFALQEFEKKDESPMARPCNPNQLVIAVSSLRPLYSNDEEFNKNALALVSTYLLLDRSEAAFEFVLKIYKHPCIRIQTKHILDYITEKGHLESFHEDEEFFAILIKPYPISLKERKNLVLEFLTLIKGEGPINCDDFFRTLHLKLRGKLSPKVEEVFANFERVFKQALSPNEKLFLYLQKLSLLPEKISLEFVEQVVFPNIQSLSYRFEKTHRLHLFHELISLQDRPHIFTQNRLFIGVFEEFLGMQLSPEIAYQLLATHLDFSKKNVEEMFHKLSELRSSILNQELDKVILSEKLVEAVNETLGRLTSSEGMLDDHIASSAAIAQFVLSSALLYSRSLHHTRCFPKGVDANDELEFSEAATPHAFLPLHPIETMKSSVGYWTQTQLGITYHFSIIHTETLATFSGSAHLPFPAQMLKEEPDLFQLLKELCWAAFSDTEMSKFPEDEVIMLTDLLSLYRQGNTLWCEFEPKELDKKGVIAPAIFSFLSALKIQSRKAMLYLATQEQFRPSLFKDEKVLQQAGAAMHIRPVTVEKQETFALLPKSLVDRSSPYFPFYAVIEDVAPLVNLMNEQVIQGKKELEGVELNLYLTLTVHNQTAISPPPQVFMTCKPETVNYEDKKYDKLHESDSHFFFQGYKLTLYFHFSDQKWKPPSFYLKKNVLTQSV